MIVTAQSIAIRHGRGRLRVIRSTGFHACAPLPVASRQARRPRPCAPSSYAARRSGSDSSSYAASMSMELLLPARVGADPEVGVAREAVVGGRGCPSGVASFETPRISYGSSGLRSTVPAARLSREVRLGVGRRLGVPGVSGPRWLEVGHGRSGGGSGRGATRRSGRGGRTAARRARASRGTRPAACSAGTRARPRARPRSSRSAATPRSPSRPAAAARRRRRRPSPAARRPESTYGPIEIASEQRCDEDPLVEALVAGREQRRAAPRAASSSTTCWSSGRPCGVSATTRWSGMPP